MKKKIVFYSILYNIKSKFNFNKYIDWLKIFVESLIDFEVVIYTNKKTYELIEENIKGYFNVYIKIKELEDFELFQYKNIFENNTNKKYFPHHDISFELILLWVNRHLLISEVKDIYYADYYCFLDIGYFRDGIIKNIDINFANNLEDKIYITLVKNELPYLKQIVNVINSKDKNLIEETLINNYYLVGGGFTIIPDNLINIWTKIFREELNFFIENNIDFKDDQTILGKIIFNKENINIFRLITTISKPKINEYLKIINNKNNEKSLENIAIKNYYIKNLYSNNINSKRIIDTIEKTFHIIFDDWFSFIYILEGKFNKIYLNDNLKYLTYSWILINKNEKEKMTFQKIIDYSTIKIYEDNINNLLFVCLDENLKELTNLHINHLLFLYNCISLQIDKNLQNNIIDEICNIFIIKITIK